MTPATATLVSLVTEVTASTTGSVKPEGAGNNASESTVAPPGIPLSEPEPHIASRQPLDLPVYYGFSLDEPDEVSGGHARAPSPVDAGARQTRACDPPPPQKSLADPRLREILEEWRSGGAMGCAEISDYLTDKPRKLVEHFGRHAEFYRFVHEVLETIESDTSQLPRDVLEWLIEAAFDVCIKVANRKNNQNMLKISDAAALPPLLEEAQLSFLRLVHRHPVMLGHFDSKPHSWQEAFRRRISFKAKFECLRFSNERSIRLGDDELTLLSNYPAPARISPETLLRVIKQHAAEKNQLNHAGTTFSGPRKNIAAHGTKTVRPADMEALFLPAAKWPRHDAGHGFAALWGEPCSTTGGIWPAGREPAGPVFAWQAHWCAASSAAVTWLPHTEPSVPALRPRDPDWMEAQSRYLDKVLWQDD